MPENPRRVESFEDVAEWLAKLEGEVERLRAKCDEYERWFRDINEGRKAPVRAPRG